MPMRLLRDGILDSERVCSLSYPAEVFYRRLMSAVDDFGRFDGRATVLRSRLYPLQIDKVREADISRWIAECEKAGLIALYSVSGKQYILFHNLGSPRAKESKYPAPPQDKATQKAPESICEHLKASESICAHVKADESRCEQTLSDAPYSYSSASTYSSADTKGVPPGVPPGLDTPEFLLAWKDWKAYRLERKLAFTERTAKSQLKMLDKLGPTRAIEVIEASIRNGWQGLFPESSNGQRTGAGQHRGPDPSNFSPDVIKKYADPRNVGPARPEAEAIANRNAPAVGPTDDPSSAESSEGELGKSEHDIPF